MRRRKGWYRYLFSYNSCVNHSAEAEIIERSADNHGLDKPIGTDGSDEDFLAYLGEGELCDTISHRHIIGEHRESCHHDDIGQGETFQIVSHLSSGLLDVHEIARDDEEGRHHKG